MTSELLFSLELVSILSFITSFSSQSYLIPLYLNRSQYESIKLLFSTAVTQELESFNKTATGLTEELASRSTSYIMELNKLEYDLEQDRKKMFTFTKLKSFLFWFGCITNIGTFLFLLVEHYLK